MDRSCRSASPSPPLPGAFPAPAGPVRTAPGAAPAGRGRRSGRSPEPAAGAAPLPRRIVFLARRDLGNPAAGGSELLVDRIAEGLTGHGHQVTLLCGGPTSERDYRVVSAGGDASHFLRVPGR
ncbi:hypothetical protein O1L55_21655 [Streptomyces albulus]|nr:hypothetical protein [Streptomyces noursei]